MLRKIQAWGGNFFELRGDELRGDELRSDELCDDELSGAPRGGGGAPVCGDAPRPRSPERWCGTGCGAAASHAPPLAGAARCSRTLLRTPSRSGTPGGAHRPTRRPRILADIVSEADELRSDESRRVTGHGSRVTGHESRVTGHESRVTGHESPVTSHDSRVTGHGSPVTSHAFQMIPVSAYGALSSTRWYPMRVRSIVS